MKWFFVPLLLLCLVSSAFAGGPLVVDTMHNSGASAHWGNNTLTWYVDQGELSSNVDHDTAVQWIKNAFDTWTKSTLENENREFVPIVDLKIIYGGEVAEDVSAATIDGYDNGDPGKTIIIFDRDGSVTEHLGLDKNGVVGLATPLSIENGTILRKGIAIFNGSMLENNRLDPNVEVAKQRFQSTIVHELGHLLNLDHSQVNGDLGLQCTTGGVCDGAQDIPTMYPELKSHLQTVLTRDDKIALGMIYPSDKFFGSFCTAIGQIQDGDGRPLRGVNVVAFRLNDGEHTKRVDARSFVSGALYGDDIHQCMNNSQYVLGGLVPGKTYQVMYEPLNSKYTDQSGFRPLGAMIDGPNDTKIPGPQPPQDFNPGNISAEGGSATISCSKGGQVIKMQTVQIEVASNPCSRFEDVSEQITVLPTKTVESSPGEQPKSGHSGGCSLVLPH